MKDGWNNSLDYWYTGQTLKNFIENSEEARKDKKRYIYKNLMAFVLSKGTKICALYGIRRTGKTVLMLQAIYDLIENYNIKPEKIAYTTIASGTDMDDKTLVDSVIALQKQGVRYVFIDEISYIKMDLESNSLNLLSDRLAKSGIKIVIAGTFSYAIRLLNKEVLFDRMRQIDTSYFSMKEAHEIFGMDMDRFIQYGGIINLDGEDQDRKMTPAEYMDTAIVQNIVNSIFKSERKYELLETLPSQLKEGKSEASLKAVVASQIRIAIDNYMKVLVVGRLSNKPVYRYSDVSKLANVIRMRSEQEQMLDESLEVLNVDKRHYFNILAEYLGNSEHVSENTFRKVIDILEDIQIKQDIVLEQERVSIFIPNYLRYGLCDQIMQRIGEMIREETHARYDATLAGEILSGTIQEAVCYLDLKKEGLKDFDMYRTADGRCEVDLIIKNHQDRTLSLYEIKHSKMRAPEQAKHLLNYDFIREIENETGYKAASYHVLYNGENHTENYNPGMVFVSLKEKSLELGKMQNADCWDALAKRAEAADWQNIAIGYKNMTEFLCELDIIR